MMTTTTAETINRALRQRQNSLRHQTVGVQVVHRSDGGRGRAAQTPRRPQAEAIVSLAKPIAAHSPTGFWPSLKALVKLQGFGVCRNSAGVCSTAGDGGVREIVRPNVALGGWAMLST